MNVEPAGSLASWRLLLKPVGQQWASQDTWLSMPGARLGLPVLPFSSLLLPPLPPSPFPLALSLFLPLGSVIQFLYKPHLILLEPNPGRAVLIWPTAGLLVPQRERVARESHFTSSSSRV